MADHVTEWLGAYYDGELHGTRLRQVEQHLAECAACQAGLDEMRDLSALLQDSAPMGNPLPTERFVANLILRMPRQSELPQPRNALRIGWWLLPASLLGIWLFLDISLSLSSVVGFAADNLFNGHWVWLQGHPLQMSWFATAMNLFGDQLAAPGREALSALNDANVFIAQLAGRLLPQVVLAVSYLGWLMSWWLRHQSQSSQSGGGLPQS